MTDYNKWKVTDLKLELKKRGLLQTGVKSLLVARLEEAENNDDFEGEETTQQDSSKSNPPSTTTNSPEAASREVTPPSETLPDAPTPSDSTVTELPHQDTNTNHDAHESSSTAAQKDPDDQRNSSDISEPDEPSLEPVTQQSPADEASEDRQKRKRASQSPTSSTLETSPKRLRTADESSATDNTVKQAAEESIENHDTRQEDDGTQIDSDVKDSEQNHKMNSEEEKNNLKPDLEDSGSPKNSHDFELESSKETDKKSMNQPDAISADTHDSMMTDPLPNQENTATSEANDLSNNTRPDSRFKGLFNGGEKSNDNDSAYDDSNPERSVTPAIHPATAALYIRDMQRPLSPQQFRFHLSTLAAPPGQEPDPELIISFYLDPIRTHAFISFKSISAASRVRSALHSRIWPDERNRKPLWVDFVPEDKLEDWITQEQESNTGGRSMAKKWEVYYEIGEDRQITASLQEASNAPLPAQQQLPSTSQHSSNQIPLGPRCGVDGAPSGPRAHYSRAQLVPVDIGGSKLNELFNSTATKPVLYWKPVSRDLANKRLDRMEDSYSAEVKAGGRVMGDPHRYTFEEGDMLVDRGVELVPGLRPPPGYRAPRPGGDRGGFSSGGWGRGGGRYRGRGGGGYRGVPNDKYAYGSETRGTRDYGRY